MVIPFAAAKRGKAERSSKPAVLNEIRMPLREIRTHYFVRSGGKVFKHHAHHMVQKSVA